jgi:hypothetical protein
MRGARLYVNQHDPPQATRPLPPPVPNAAQSTPSHLEYLPPTPTSLIESPPPVCGSSGSSPTVPSSSRSEPPVLAAIPQRSPRFPLLYSRRRQRDAPQRSHDDVNLSLKDRECPVCCRQGCLLVSHKLYASRKKSRPSQPARTIEKQPQVSLTPSIGNARVDPFFDLPIGNSDPEQQQYFCDFFTSQSSSMTSPVRILAFDSAYLPLLLRQALTDPALCHTLIAMAATYSSVHGKCLQAPDAKLFSIYGRTFRVLRQHVSQNRHRRPSDSTIMAAINLLMCHGLAFGDKSAIAAHPVALKNLVDGCGSISNLNGQPAALTLWADYYVTLYTGEKPNFLEQAGVMPDVPLSNPPPAVYGGGLESLVERGLISPALLDVCQQTCRLTELLEDRVSGNANQARWEYFNYKRNTMAMRNGCVHAELFGSGTKAECISLVHNLYMFLALRLMPWKAPIVNLCDQLRSALLASGLNDYWAGDVNVLTWVLFILLASAKHWEGKQWALQLLLDTLSHHYASELTHWPPNWFELQRLNLMRFTWSETYLSESFKTTCRDLAMICQSRAGVSAKEEGLPYSASYAVSDILEHDRVEE